MCERVCVRVCRPTSQSSLSPPVYMLQCLCHNTYYFLQRVCMFVCERICLRTYSESLNMCSFESLSLSLCLSLCFISLSVCCLGRDDTLFFHIYPSVFPSIFVFHPGVFFLFFAQVSVPLGCTVSEASTLSAA